MLGTPQPRGEGTIPTVDPWRAIRWNRRLWFSLPLLLGLGLILGAWLFPALELQELLERVGTSGSSLDDSSSSACAVSPMSSAFSHLEHSKLAALVPYVPEEHLCADQFYNSPCPHCGLSLGAQPKRG